MADQRPWEIVREEFACDHRQTDIRKMITSNGAKQYVRQCLRCGHNCGFVRKDSIVGVRYVQMEEFDEQLRQDWFARQQARSEELKEQSSEEWWADYNAYLSSDEWRERRDAVLARDGKVCQGCRNRRATQVHHLTYARRGREMLFDLVSVCDLCHESIHGERSED